MLFDLLYFCVVLIVNYDYLTMIIFYIMTNKKNIRSSLSEAGYFVLSI